jgi:hypothetical protein
MIIVYTTSNIPIMKIKGSMHIYHKHNPLLLLLLLLLSQPPRNK